MTRYTAVGTPELVTSWIADPSLLVSNRGLPERMVLDAADFRRRQRAVLGGWGDHYDIFVWYWLEFMRLRGYVHLVNFRSFITSDIRYEIGIKARELSLKVAPTELVDDYRRALLGWRQFGLLPRQHPRKDDPVFQLATRMTERELSQLERGGNARVDPILLEARCIAKLLTGVQVARSLRSVFGVTLVFDTPQHELFANRLEASVFAGLERFGMAGQGYAESSTRLQGIMERLGLGAVKYPFVLGQLDLLADSLSELEKLQEDIGDARSSWHEVEQRIGNYRRIVRDKRWAQLRQLTTSLIPGFATPPSAPYALLAGLMSAWFIEREISGVHETMPRYIRLALTNKIMARIMDRPNVEELDKWALIALRRTAFRIRAKLPRAVRVPAELEGEALRREEIGNWVSNDVWYHPHC